MKLAGKAAIVTGAGQGIGGAIATRLAAEGARVALLDLKADQAEKLIQTFDNPKDHLAIATNVGDSASVISAIRQARKEFGRIDFAVNNAGIGQASGDGSDKFYASMNARNEELAAGKAPTTFVDHLIHMEDDGWAGVMAVNLNGAFYVCREAVRIMAEDGNSGSIVNISSTSAQSGEGSPHYVTSKSALIGLSRQLARELAPRGIRVNAVAPGPTNTPIMNGLPQEWITSMEQSVPLGRMAKPDEVASAVAYLLSDDASFVTGSVLVANGGSYCF
ncbi:MAG: SDR family NAD(P)-dependent oxidoreductase [Maricaulaceae bacterium]